MTHRHLLPALFLLAAPAFAATSLQTFVSLSTGNNSNVAFGCSEPYYACADLPTALGVTSPNGVLTILDATTFGALEITTPVTIDFGGNSGDDIDVNTAGTVILRNLTLIGQGGIVITSNRANLRLENVTITGAPTFGVGLNCQTGTCSLDRVKIQNAQNGGSGVAVLTGTAVSSTGVKVFISNSDFRNNDTAVSSIDGAVIQVDNSFIQQNGIGVSTESGAYFGVSSGGAVRLSNNTITDNVTGLQVGGTGASIISFGNNRIFGNTTNGNPTVATSNR
jgi:hypothetical protein